MHCRPYRIADRDDCIRAFRSNTPSCFLPDELADYERFLDVLPGPYFAVVGEAGVIACGGIATGRVAGEADVCWTIVHAHYHRQGAGNLLMASCVAEILALPGCESARLDTSQHTRAFFERWGFTATSVTANGYGPGLDRVEMRIVLDERARDTWNEMLTGGLTPPLEEKPIPAIESYKEWSANRYNPGHYLGGRLEPHLDQLRTGPRGKRIAGWLLGVSAVLTTFTTAAFSVGSGGWEAVGSLALIIVAWAAAIRMYRKGGSADADNR